MSEPLVIIGNGMAAARLCEELVRRALGRHAIAVIGEEPQLAYNRVLLSSVLAGEVAASETLLKPANWWRDRGVTFATARRRPRSIFRPAPSRSPTAKRCCLPSSSLPPAPGLSACRLPAQPSRRADLSRPG